jgi:prepilin-type N-terminal cleavage/methylation domain-containing protein
VVKNLLKQKSNRGFTLIELVVVIVILAVLAATALPKFVNISQDAHDAVAKTAFASFKSAVSLYHNCWLASGEPADVLDLDCFGAGDVDSTFSGYPLGLNTAGSGNSGTTLTGDFCRQLWVGLLNDDFKLAIHADASFGDNNDIIYWYSSADITLPTAHCYFNYIADDRTKGQENWQMRYFPGTGEITVGRATLG